MNKKISFVCPTLNRSVLQTRLTNSIFQNAANPSQVEIIFGINDNDPVALETAKQLQLEYGEQSVKFKLVSPDEKLPNISNICAIECASGDIIGNIADDVLIESKNWDVTVIEEFSRYPDGILLLWSDDGLWGGSLASHYFIHKNWIKALGHVQPTHFHADWTDHWNQRLAEKVGRTKCIKDRSRLFLHHLHAEFGGMEKDDTYWKVKEKRERNVKEGLKFNGPNIPSHLLEMHDMDYKKLMTFIRGFKNENDR